MSQKKKRIRNEFRDAVFERDEYTCRMCGEGGVDPHHIINRSLFPNGGYVAENGISLCSKCHERAEAWITCSGDDAFSPAKLYEMIGSSLTDALAADAKMEKCDEE
jgi:5-methylcytosine-specific restriction endonuclease McrA